MTEEYIKCYDRIMTPDGTFKKVSRFTSTESIVCMDGKPLEQKLNDISGITSDLNCADEKIAASAKATNTLYKSTIALNGKVDQCFQSVSEGKRLLASAITDKGITTEADATFQQMATNVKGLITMSSNPNVLFDAGSWRAPYNCIAVMSWSIYWKANHDYDQISKVTLSGVRNWDLRWGGTHDSHWHDYNSSGNITWEAKAGVTYSLTTNLGDWREVLTHNWPSRTWIVPR